MSYVVVGVEDVVRRGVEPTPLRVRALRSLALFRAPLAPPRRLPAGAPVPKALLRRSHSLIPPGLWLLRLPPPLLLRSLADALSISPLRSTPASTLLALLGPGHDLLRRFGQCSLLRLASRTSWPRAPRHLRPLSPALSLILPSRSAPPSASAPRPLRPARPCPLHFTESHASVTMIARFPCDHDGTAFPSSTPRRTTSSTPTTTYDDISLRSRHRYYTPEIHVCTAQTQPEEDHCACDTVVRPLRRTTTVATTTTYHDTPLRRHASTALQHTMANHDGRDVLLRALQHTTTTMTHFGIRPRLTIT